MKRRKPLFAYFIVRDNGTCAWVGSRQKTNTGERLVKVVEHSPAKEKLVRLSVELANAYHSAEHDWIVDTIERFKVAAQRYER